MKSKKPGVSLRLFLAMATLSFAAGAIAANSTGSITSITVNSTGTPVDDYITDVGTFSPASGCTYNGFVIAPTDDNFNQIYAGLLAVKIALGTVTWSFSYCITTGPFAGYARASWYTLN